MKADLSGIDFLALVSRYTTVVKKVAHGKNGGDEYKGPCPVCGGRDRFAVWPHHKAGKGRWYCRKCNQAGDAGDFLTFIQPGMSEAEKWAVLKSLGAKLDGDHTYGTGELPTEVQRTLRPPQESCPPSATWQAMGRRCLAYAQEQLWQDEAALAYLIGRGLTRDLIREAGLGYIPKSISDRAERWGLDPAKGGVWIPRGWMIPWFLDGQLWRLNVRRHPDDLARAQVAEDAKAAEEDRTPQKVAKYIGPRGWGGGSPLYRGDRIGVDRPVIMVEGEIKAFALLQVAEDLVEVVATGSTTGARAARWIGLLGATPLVLLAFDNDENGSGDETAAWWRRILPNSRRFKPLWADPDQMAQDGLDLRDWVQGALEMCGWEPARRASLARKTAASAVQSRPELMLSPAATVPMPAPADLWRDPYGVEPASWPATVLLPDWQGIVVPANWERRSDGTIQATFSSMEEWELCRGAARTMAADLAEAHYQAGDGGNPEGWWQEYRKIALLAGWEDVGEWIAEPVTVTQPKQLTLLPIVPPLQ